MGAVAAGAAAAGGVIGAYGAIQSAQDQANLDNEKAAIAFKQADEIQNREVANEAIRNSQANEAKLSFGAAYASSGKEGVGIGSQLEIQRQTDLQNTISKRDADFQAEMLRTQGGIDQQLADETKSAGYLSAASSILGGASSAARLSAPNTTPGTQSLPPPKFSG